MLLLNSFALVSNNLSIRQSLSAPMRCRAAPKAWPRRVWLNTRGRIEAPLRRAPQREVEGRYSSGSSHNASKGFTPDRMAWAIPGGL